MHPTYEELFAQNQILAQQLREALAEIQILKAENQVKGAVPALGITFRN